MHYHITTYFPTGQKLPVTTEAVTSLKTAAAMFTTRKTRLEQEDFRLQDVTLRPDGTVQIVLFQPDATRPKTAVLAITKSKIIGNCGDCNLHRARREGELQSIAGKVLP